MDEICIFGSWSVKSAFFFAWLKKGAFLRGKEYLGRWYGT